MCVGVARECVDHANEDGKRAKKKAVNGGEGGGEGARYLPFHADTVK